MMIAEEYLGRSLLFRRLKKRTRFKPSDRPLDFLEAL
jgi:hypothetical protein